MATLIARAFGSLHLPSLTVSLATKTTKKTVSSINYYNMPRGRPICLQTVDLKGRMCCTGCERVVKNAIYKLRGIDSVEVDLGMEKVTVIGYVDRNKALKQVRRAGKRVEFWPHPDPPLYFHLYQRILQRHNERVQRELQLLQAWQHPSSNSSRR